MVKFIRKSECCRCGQCCGVDDVYPWAKSLQESMKSFSPEEVELYMPIIALIGLPAHTGKNSGIVTIGDKEFPYIWHENGQLAKQGTDSLCPFVYYHEENGPWICALVDTEEQWRWERQCKKYPRRIRWHEREVKEFHEAVPKCSYKYRIVDE